MAGGHWSEGAQALFLHGGELLFGGDAGHGGVTSHRDQGSIAR
jgi:hypothetical protein